jgi:hypothetical protein
MGDAFTKKLSDMKRSLSIIFILAAALNAGIAQNADDALRYSQIFYNGTARFMGMGGAFTALGGDLSALSQNPAGIGLFRSSEFSISPQLFNFRSTSNFSGGTKQDYLYDFSLGQAGVVLNLVNNNTQTGLVGMSVGYSFNRTNNFNQTIRMQGISQNNSLLDAWASALTLRGIPAIDTIMANAMPDAYLGWNTWLLDTLPGTDNAYGTVYSDYGQMASVYGQEITRLVTNSGYTGEHAISLGGNWSNRLFLGATLAITRLSYESKFEHMESTDAVLPSQFKDFNYTFYYKNTGTGYALKLGAIFKPIEPLRIGLSFHSPTFFRITEYVYDNIYTHINNDDIDFSNETMWYSYNLTTPFRATAGVAYQLKKLAVFSAEYEFVDYSMARFSVVGDDDWDYTPDNDYIKSALKSASNIRAGAEFRLNRFYLRGGYGYYGKAYESYDVNSIVDYHSVSLGAGFREQNLYLDFGFTRMTNPNYYILYQYEKSPGSEVIASSHIDVDRNIFTVTFGYKFGY